MTDFTPPAELGCGAESPPPPPIGPRAPSADLAAPLAPGLLAARHALAPERLARQAEEHRRMVGAEHAAPRRRRIGLPLTLFLLTCASTFYVGASGFLPDFRSGEHMRRMLLEHWPNGLIYMTCVLAILLTHEMGHFLMTLRYRIASTLPFFIPFPIAPIGTMGAVIAMDGLSANRKQMFDIGLAGPIAGLVVALPIMWLGVTQLDLTRLDPAKVDRQVGLHGYHLPWLVQEMLAYAQPKGYLVTSITADEQGRPVLQRHPRRVEEITTLQLNPFFMAGWVGLLITGLNMMPISQLDGGHVIYALFGRRAHVIARVFLFVAFLFVVIYFERTRIWLLMLLLVTLMGTDHPPTADDRVPLGPGRTLLGWASLLIPIFCFPFYGLRPLGM